MTEPIVVALVAQAAAEYGGMAGGAAPGGSGGAIRLPDSLPLDLFSDPLVLAAAGLALLVVIGLFRTRRYRA
jgi:hypothetical protein